MPTRVVDPSSSDQQAVEISVVMPCLNEAETVGACVRKALETIREHGILGEVIVADNGSTDGSPAIAQSLGARVVNVEERGYGSALMGGIASSRGLYVLMADADDSYDFSEIPRVLDKLREGYDLVQGCRLPSGGGTVKPGAMPWLHRWIGNPLFSALVRRWFGAPIHDVHAGMRAFSTDFARSLDQRCTGMEFASEMVIKASLRGAKIAEVPITLHPDGRRTRRPHLRTFRDGWRHLRFYLVYSPRWLFLVPGVALMLAGMVGYAIALPGLQVGGINFDVNTLLFASLAVIAGFQSVLFAMLTKVFAITEGLIPHDTRFERVFAYVNLERGLLAGVAAMIVGSVLLLGAINQWRAASFGALDYAHTTRWVIPGVTLTTLGIQTVLSSFFLSVLGLRRR